MNEKKYILTDETLNFSGHTLHRIRAVKDFGDIKAGDLGGWIESEENLSQEGTCWVYDEARIYGEAQVFGKACVDGKAQVFAKARVGGEAEVFSKAQVYGEAKVFGKARVHDEAEVYGKACLNAKNTSFLMAETQKNFLKEGFTMKNDFKQKLSNARTYVKEHKKDFAMLGIGLAVGTATIVFACKLHLEGVAQRAELEAEGKKILKTFLNQTTIEGSGPIWDKLRDIFKNEAMKPGDIWMIGADNVGKKVISYITDGPLEIIEF